MKTSKVVLSVAGARPNFIKIAPLSKAMECSDSFDNYIVHTGQHYDPSMSKVFFDELGIPEPHINLKVGSGTRIEQIDKVMERFAPVVESMNPDLILVVGDVNSTIAGARVARRYGIPVAHVEAGLRSFDSSMPEEINRVETDQLADFLFVTEPSGMVNLEDEEVSGRRFLVGNVMIDSLIAHLNQAEALHVPNQLGLVAGEYFVGTFHRPSNVDEVDKLKNIIDIVEHVAATMPIVLPLHPRTRKSLDQKALLDRLMDNVHVRIIDPVSYVEFLSIVSGAKGIVTDSGGIQEETTYLGVPCVTMRANTERPVTVEVGTNVLAGIDPESVKQSISNVFNGSTKRGEIPALWDGHAAERIISILKQELTA